MEHEFDDLRDELKETLYKALNISQDIIKLDYVTGNNLKELYVDNLFEIPLEILKLIRKV